MRVQFKRLAMRIDNGEDVTSARWALNQLIHATLDRETSADDTDLLCEVFRGLDTVVAQEVSNSSCQHTNVTRSWRLAFNVFPRF